jgi:hypothetical protein
MKFSQYLPAYCQVNTTAPQASGLNLLIKAAAILESQSNIDLQAKSLKENPSKVEYTKPPPSFSNHLEIINLHGDTRHETNRELEGVISDV